MDFLNLCYCHHYSHLTEEKLTGYVILTGTLPANLGFELCDRSSATMA